MSHLCLSTEKAQMQPMAPSPQEISDWLQKTAFNSGAKEL